MFRSKAKKASKGNIIHLSDATFDSEVLQSDIPVLVDFWAIWCGPCHMVAPIVEELSVTHAGKLKVAKVDVDSCQRTAARFNIRSIPTLLVFKEGRVVDQIIGAQPKRKIVAAVDRHL